MPRSRPRRARPGKTTSWPKKKRIEMIEPIQKQVFSAIEAYAKQVGADVVLDSANNPTLLYSNPSVDRTQQVIDVLKK